MAARASAKVPPKSPIRDGDGFKEFEEAFFRAGESVVGHHDCSATGPSTARRVLARVVAFTIFSAALIMAWKAFGTTLKDRAAVHTQLQGVARCAHVVGNRDAWPEPPATARPSTPRQHPHSTTAARNRRR